MEKICIVLGRKIQDNIDRELNLISAFKRYNIDVHFLIFGSNLTYSYLTKNDLKKFNGCSYTFINDLNEVHHFIENFKYYLIASWRDYDFFVKILKKSKKKVIIYSDAGGIDFWDNGGKTLLFKSKANQIVYCKARRNRFVNIYRSYLSSKSRVTGSLRYEYFSNNYDKNNNELDVVFFPKSLDTLSLKIRDWFKNKNDEWYANHIIQMKNIYKFIYSTCKGMGLKFNVRLHYAQNDKMFAKNLGQIDYEFWNSIDEKLILYEDERNIFKNMKLGIGVESHSAIDVNLHNKPYIMFKPDYNLKPQVRGFDLCYLFGKEYFGAYGYKNDQSKLIENKNYLWLPYWYGLFSDSKSLEQDINIILKNKNLDYERLNKIKKFYWGDSNLLASENIAKEVIKTWFKSVIPEYKISSPHSPIPIFQGYETVKNEEYLPPQNVSDKALNNKEKKISGKLNLLFNYFLTKVKFSFKRLISIKQTYLFRNNSIFLPRKSKFIEFKYFHKLYDEFVPILSKNMPSGSIIIDVGANVGTTLFGILKYSKNYRHKIISIEGSKFFFNYLKLNLKNFLQLKKKVDIQILNSIVSDKKGNLKIINDGSSGIIQKANIKDKNSVDVSTLNNYLKNIKIDKNILVKIDTDGYDSNVIRSGLNETQKKNPIFFTELLFEKTIIKDTLKVYDELTKINYDYFSIFSSSGKYLTTVNSTKHIKNFIDFFNSNAIQFGNECEYFDILIYQEKHKKIILKSLDDLKKIDV